MSKKKSTKRRARKPPSELPPGFIFPEPSPEFIETNIPDGIVLGIDPARLSGYAILECVRGEACLIESGTCNPFVDDTPDSIVLKAASLARYNKVPLKVITEHSKAPHGSGKFGINGFIGMIRAQGAWYRAVQANLTKYITDEGQFRIGRRTGIKPGAITLIEPTAWRKEIFGTVRFRDADGKSCHFRREHWKAMAVGAVSKLHPGTIRGEDESEAILIAHYGARAA